jgi:hypothetical protein
VKSFIGGLVAGVVLVVMAVFADDALPLDTLAAIAIGWGRFIVRVVPRVTVHWGGVATGATVSFLVIAGVHQFGRWWLNSGAPTDDLSPCRWRLKWTLSVVGVVIVMFCAGISLVGVAHEVGWLLTTKDSLIAWEGGRSPAKRTQSKNQLKQIGLALHNYYDVFETFPHGGTFDEFGEPQHGWTTFVLPYFDQAELYKRVDFRFPWNHPVNSPVFQTLLIHLLRPGIDTWESSDGFPLTHYAANSHVLNAGPALRIKDVTDGVSNTIFIGEVNGDFKPWGHPVNWRDPATGINRSPVGFGSPSTGGAQFLLMDGSVKFLNDNIHPTILKALSTPNGGETIPDF